MNHEYSWIEKREQTLTDPTTIELAEEERDIIQQGLLKAGFKSECQKGKLITVFFLSKWNNNKICALIWRTAADWHYLIVNNRWWLLLEGESHRELLLKTITELPIFDLEC